MVSDTEAAVRCPHCAYPASAEDKVCTHCGHDLPRAASSVWPFVAVAAAAGVGALLALRSGKKG